MNMLSRVELCRAVYTHSSAVVTQFPVLQPTSLDKFSTCSVFNFHREPFVNPIHTDDAIQLDSWVASALTVCIGHYIVFSSPYRVKELNFSGKKYDFSCWWSSLCHHCVAGGSTRAQSTDYVDTGDVSRRSSRRHMVVVYNYDARPTPNDRQGEVVDTGLNTSRWLLLWLKPAAQLRYD